MEAQRPNFVWGLGSVRNPDDRRQTGLMEKVLDRGLWMHTGFDYTPNNSVLAAVLKRRAAKNVKLIAKVKAHNSAVLAGQVDRLLVDTGAERLALVQVADNPAGSLLLPGGALRKTMEELVASGKVGGFLLEFFWEYSENLRDPVHDRFFDGAIFYFNTVHREINNGVFESLLANDRPIAALMPLGGGINTLSGTTGRAAINRFVPYLRRRQIAAVLADIRRQSGIADEAEFRYRYLLSIPQVRWIIGGASTAQHLDQAINFVQQSEPLRRDLRDSIIAFQKELWAQSGLRIGAGTRRTFLEKVMEKYRAMRRIT